LLIVRHDVVNPHLFVWIGDARQESHRMQIGEL
jgi:hypothetical protein